MSRNFELLQQVENGLEVLSSSPRESSPGSRPAGVDGFPPEYEPLINLVQRVFLVPYKEVPHTVVFSGADRNSGCTWICAHTSKVLSALVPGTVCVVDANLRSPGLHQYFELQNACGVMDALTEASPIQKFVQTPNGNGKISILCSGSRIPNQTANVDLNRLRSRVKELRQEFDYVLVDAPSMDLYTDGIVLGGVSDGLILVLGAHSSRRETARTAVQALNAANVALLGAVLNKRSFPIPNFIYRRL